MLVLSGLLYIIVLCCNRAEISARTLSLIPALPGLPLASDWFRLKSGISVPLNLRGLLIRPEQFKIIQSGDDSFSVRRSQARFESDAFSARRTPLRIAAAALNLIAMSPADINIRVNNISRRVDVTLRVYWSTILLLFTLVLALSLLPGSGGMRAIEALLLLLLALASLIFCCTDLFILRNDYRGFCRALAEPSQQL